MLLGVSMLDLDVLRSEETGFNVPSWRGSATRAIEDALISAFGRANVIVGAYSYRGHHKIEVPVTIRGIVGNDPVADWLRADADWRDTTALLAEVRRCVHRARWIRTRNRLYQFFYVCNVSRAHDKAERIMSWMTHDPKMADFR